MEAILKSLGFNTTVFLLQVVLFIALWNVLSVLFWNPMLAHLRQRDQNIDDAYKTVKATQQELETLRADYLARIAQVEADARSRIQIAIKEAQTERERILAEARATADATLKQGVADMEREKTEALVSLRGSMVGLALSALGKALGPNTDQVALRRTVEERIGCN